LKSDGCVRAELSRNCPLADDEIRIWRVTPDSATSDSERLWLVLSSDERQRADQFHFEADRWRYIVGRGFLRLLVGEILNLSGSVLRFDYGEFGKPRLIKSQEQGVRFSISHSGELMLIAVTKGRAVGVDVERVRADFDFDEVAPHFFSTSEFKSLALLTGPSRHEAFFTCWTRKEAYLKARGDGLSLPLDQFDVSLLPGDEAWLLETRHDPGDAHRWSLFPVTVPSGYVATVAAEGSGWKLKYRDLPPALASQESIGEADIPRHVPSGKIGTC
jgi:4'-phosphopantetheinyl transferase